MNQNNRFCTQQGHECFEVNQICTYRECDMKRWCCSQCLSDYIHKHLMSDSNHIMNQENFSNKVKQDIENLRKEYLKSKQRANIKSTGQQMVKEVKELEEQVIDNQISNEEVNFKLKQLAQKVEGQNFIQLNDEDINELLHIDQQQFNYDDKLQLQDSMDDIQQSIILEQNEKQYQENNKNKIIDFKSRQYDIQRIHVTDDRWCNMSSLISNNEQYLVYNVRNLLYIYDLKKDKIYKTLKLKWQLITFQFTIDSKILFDGDCFGYVYGYFVKNGFKRIYKQKIHKTYITQLIVLKEYLITASSDRTIIKTNFIKKNQIFKLIGHSNYITCIDYDILRDIMISISPDRTLKVWDCFNQSILIEHNLKIFNYHSLIQLIDKKQKILKCDEYSLQKFSIDYQNKKLVETYSYKGDDCIWELQSFNNDQNLLLIYNKNQYCKILNKEKEQIVVIPYHEKYINMCILDRPDYRCYRHQLDNLNYIILQDRKLLHYKQGYCLLLLRFKDYN